MSRLAFRTPESVGLKLTLTVALSPGKRGVVVGLNEAAKSWLAVPETATLWMV